MLRAAKLDQLLIGFALAGSCTGALAQNGHAPGSHPPTPSAVHSISSGHGFSIAKGHNGSVSIGTSPAGAHAGGRANAQVISRPHGAQLGGDADAGRGRGQRGTAPLLRDNSVADGKFTVNTGRQINAAQAELRANGGNVLGLAVNTAGVNKAGGVVQAGGRIVMTGSGGAANGGQRGPSQQNSRENSRPTEGQTQVARAKAGETLVAHKPVPPASKFATRFSSPDKAGSNVRLFGSNLVINNEIDAKATGGKGGKIVIAGKDITLTSNSLLNASGASGGVILIVGQHVTISGELDAIGTSGVGGKIIIASRDVTLTSNSVLNVSGAAGGGSVLIRGGSNGVFVAQGASISANATASGPGGTVVVQSGGDLHFAGLIAANGAGSGLGGKVQVTANGQTSIAGTITAMGASGGSIETSGGQLLISSSASIKTGPQGTWLLDPTDLTVNTAVAGVIQSSLNGGTSVALQTNANGTTSGPGNTSSGPGDIIVNAAIAWSSGSTLTLNAYNAIAINASITVQGAGGLVLTAASNPLAPAAPLISFGNGASVQFTGRPNSRQSLTINGAPYQLLYSIADVRDIKHNLTGNYALALPLNALGVTWIPIGTDGGNVLNSGNGFTGTFQGLGNTISNVTITPTPAKLYSVGLFGVIGSGGVVSNLTVAGASITADPNLGSFATQSIGVLAGQNSGTITNVTVAGQINGLSIAGVTAGGLVGQNSTFTGATAGTVVGSQAAVNITLGDGISCTSSSCGPQNAAGGLVGYNPGTIFGSSASGNIIVGANSFAGGLVAQNGNCCDMNGNPIVGASITNSYASGTVSSAGINVSLGGLVGQNMPLSLITSSQAYGAVSSTASLSPSGTNNCSGSCQFVDVGGFVGFNFGTISGAHWTMAPTTCASSFACAGGNVSVGQLGSGGGFAGGNDGVINYAFATGNVTGAAGLPSSGGQGPFSNNTSIAGFVSSNTGQISNSFAIGTVGTAGTDFLRAGGFADSNHGTIVNSFSKGAVITGNSANAGGFVAENTLNSGTNCPGCFRGDGDNNNASITNSQAYGNVTVGASSIAGGFAALAGSPGDGSGNPPGGTFTNITAYGAVQAGSNSIIGGLVGLLLDGASISNSSAQNTIVASSGANSIVGGIAGVVTGSISNTTTSAPVSGTSASYIGGIAGINFGLITQSATSSAITGSGSGSGNFIGGIAGLNAGSISGSNVNVALSNGGSSYVGGIAGVNGTSTSQTITFPNSSFPTGTITSSSATGSGFSGPVGTTAPATAPAVPSWLSSCSGVTICSLLTGGILQGLPPQGPPPLEPPPQQLPPQQPPPQQVAQNVVTTTSNTTTTSAPVVNTGTTQAGTTQGAQGGTTQGAQGGTTQTAPLTPSAPSAPGTLNSPPGQIDAGPGRFFFIPPPGETRYVHNRIFAEADPGVPLATLQQLAAQLGLTIIASQTTGLGGGQTIYEFQINNGALVADIARQMVSFSFLKGASPIYIHTLAEDAARREGDPGQYVIDKLKLTAVHRRLRGERIEVAIIDSQIDAAHPDLDGVVIRQYDATGGATEEPHPHGTGMAGAIAAHRRLVGIAPGAHILAIHAFSSKPASVESTTFNIVKGLDYAVANGVRIVNMSFVGPRDPAFERRIKDAYDKGVIMIAAAGNAGPKSPPLYPAADPHVIAVTATDIDDKLFAGANRGRYIAVAAPGVDVVVTAPADSYQLTTGTSVASAIVSGITALMLEHNPKLSPNDVHGILKASAMRLGPSDQFGAGLVDPVKALELATPRPPAL